MNDDNGAVSRASGASYPRLVGDVGGTSARFGWVPSAGSGIVQIARYAGSDHAGLGEVIAHYLREQALPAPPACAIGIATAVTGDTVTMTNRDWSFSIGALQQRFNFERFVIINDFTALALALPMLAAHELRQVGGGAAAADAAMALIGPGTGLGVSGLVPAGGDFVAIAGEGGHATLCAASAAEDRIIEILRRRYGHVSAERVLSGPGLVNLHRACCEMAGCVPEPLGAPQISALALQGDDEQCRAAVDAFFAFLGSAAGNLALTLGARGGVYIGGGIVPQLGDAIVHSRFRERFEAKGRFRAYLEQIRTWVVTPTDDTPALRGANHALDR